MRLDFVGIHVEDRLRIAIQLPGCRLRKTVSQSLGIWSDPNKEPCSYSCGIYSLCPLDDVKFSVSWPWSFTQGPEGGPCTADIRRHLSNIGNDETVCELKVTFNSHALSTDSIDIEVIAISVGLVIVLALAQLSLAVHFHHGIIAFKANQSTCESSTPAAVGNKSMGWVTSRKEVEVVEES